ncbi:MAG: MoxR family ATPase [Candidatus Eremiobacteraeota bacterium]|nr:MoxR family ATPase [Candidatus Eremiobacteraeota bacterium]
MSQDPILPAVQTLGERLYEHGYVADRGLTTAVHLALRLPRPLLLEGEAGVGKTEVGKVLAEILQTKLIRLQCYEGIDVSHALYEWNYARQMLHIRALETHSLADREKLREIFSPEFLIRRPLLQAIDNDAPTPPVLLIDEIDRADEEFEAFLLELLSDYQITIPEIGTMRATVAPVVVLTSNRTREIHDALKRRCLYYWIPYPSLEKEMEIVKRRLPEAPALLVKHICSTVQELRRMDMQKSPGVAETLDWAAALMALGHSDLEIESARDTLCVISKVQEDTERIEREMPAILRRASA